LAEDRGGKLPVGGKEGKELTAGGIEAGAVHTSQPQIGVVMDYPDHGQLFLKPIRQFPGPVIASIIHDDYFVREAGGG
jgi:hypothetical protein